MWTARARSNKVLQRCVRGGAFPFRPASVPALVPAAYAGKEEGEDKRGDGSQGEEDSRKGEGGSEGGGGERGRDSDAMAVDASPSDSLCDDDDEGKDKEAATLSELEDEDEDEGEDDEEKAAAAAAASLTLLHDFLGLMQNGLYMNIAVTGAPYVSFRPSSTPQIAAASLLLGSIHQTEPEIEIKIKIKSTKHLNCS